MKNFEKYRHLKFDDCSIMFENVCGERCMCNCDNCVFRNMETFCEFMNVEVVEPIRLTRNEKAILESVDKTYRYIARDKSENLYLYDFKPFKRNDGWSSKSCFADFYCFNHLFQFIKWEDEPYSIEELLKCEVVDDE